MKKFFQTNKVLATMLLIVIICTVISVVLLLKYFYFGNGSSKYGDRLDGIKEVEINDSKINEITDKINADELVDSSKITITGKIVYIRIVFGTKTSLVEAQSKAVKSLDNFTDEEKNFYDFEFTLIKESTDEAEGFKIMGAKNVNGSNLVWNNNNVAAEEEK